MPNWKKVIVSGSDATLNSLFVTNAVTASIFSGSYTGSLYGTASYSSWSSFPISVNNNDSLYSTYPAAAGGTGVNNVGSIILGNAAGFNAEDGGGSVYLGSFAGYEALVAAYSNFIGYYAGRNAAYADSSNFLGKFAGYFANYARLSNFLGESAGEQASMASGSNFFGYYAGNGQTDAAYSNLFGYQVGKLVGSNVLGSNNILIGTNITLETGRKDSINLGSLIFGTGSYSTVGGSPFSGSTNGRVGINQPLPRYSLDVSGSGNYTNGLTVTGSLIASSFTGSLLGTASNVLGGIDKRIALWTGSSTTLGVSAIHQSGSGNTANIGINTSDFMVGAAEALLVSGSTYNIIVGESTQNNYTQLNIHNHSNGNNASSDIVATNDTGTETGNYVNLGINSSGFAGLVGLPSESYLYNTGSNFLIGNITRGTNANLKFFAGNDATIFPLIVTGSVTIVTGSLLGTASFAVSASWAPGGGGAGLKTKSGFVSPGSFAGNPKIYAVTFSAAFTDANYSITVTGEDSRAWSVQSKVSGSFIINSNSNTGLGGTTYWQAVAYGETA